MGWAFFFFDLQEGAPRPVLFEPVIGASRNTRLLPFDHRTTGARRGQGKCAESRQGETPQAGQAQGQRQQKQEGCGAIPVPNAVARLHPCRIETGRGGFGHRRVVYDGALGNNAGLQGVTQTGLHLISKLRHDSKLYFPFAGEYSGKGRRRKYGEKLTPETLTEAHLKSESVEKDIRTRVYQAQAWHRNFPELLNVFVIVKTDMKTGRTAKVLLFSDDLALASETLIHYYSLRFQIEFNFRDAKQYWGLEDFMNIKEAQVGTTPTSPCSW